MTSTLRKEPAASKEIRPEDFPPPAEIRELVEAFADVSAGTLSTRDPLYRSAVLYSRIFDLARDADRAAAEADAVPLCSSVAISMRRATRELQHAAHVARVRIQMHAELRESRRARADLSDQKAPAAS